ncbi:hypothetical protein BKE30_12090 [Alkanindiges hydrocarboniclasticus]|uniref:diguanylate cyclase n=1 Tax=Alkanindiges hydrocarboniclasticus TaxID=1907941 RepID=A0A1S8CTT6_9GAMM|nr:sensor domain-containing diguanylate cyclase [Alkanindiges hydrocarboniclasticus]ONG38666.1 hypothetical protein BKE30_12090 [Alkanindiges hydrocarboniclasticus]
MDLQVFDNFENAGQAVLSFLHKRLGFDLWMITRTEGDDWIVLQSEDHGYGVKPGQVFRWADSFCCHMVEGLTPRMAPCSDLVTLYASAPIAQQITIKSYIGYPLLNEHGELFGTLCAIDPQPKPESLKLEENLIELLGGLLSLTLQKELKLAEHSRYLERLKAESCTDELTQVYNERGWEKLLEAEEERSRRYGHFCAIYMLDLDGFKEINNIYGRATGDALLQRAAQTLKNNTGKNDIIARVGADEFAILKVNIDKKQADLFCQYLIDALQRVNVAVSIGCALRHPATTLKLVQAQAATLMQFHQQNKPQN